MQPIYTQHTTLPCSGLWPELYMHLTGPVVALGHTETTCPSA